MNGMESTKVNFIWGRIHFFIKAENGQKVFLIGG
jgi:hypothetical protein